MHQLHSFVRQLQAPPYEENTTAWDINEFAMWFIGSVIFFGTPLAAAFLGYRKFALAFLILMTVALIIAVAQIALQHQRRQRRPRRG